ncbi:MAG TPA: hypothetical protein VNW95_01205 [Mucilaginibacter sp.]|jgi:hypothetical protein|nr:hypothetical protein [Mucilaginibacter sp.]
MVKSIFILGFSFLFFNAVFAQKVNNQLYYRIDTKGLTQIIVNQDTITSKKSSADNQGYFVEMRSLIVKVVKKNDYEFIITQPLNDGYKEAYNKEKFNVGCLRYKTSDHYVHIISETTLYNSLSDCDAAITRYEPGSKIYFTLFTQEDIDKFKTYKNLLLLPDDEQKNIYIKLKDLMIENKTRMLNTQTGLYGIAMAKELANRVLIANKINPLLSEDDFDKFIKKYM